MKRMGPAVLGLVVLLAASLPLAAQTPGKAWSERWKVNDGQWLAYHLMGVKPDRLDARAGTNVPITVYWLLECYGIAEVRL